MQLTSEQQIFVDTILNSKQSVLLKGKAGVGKSVATRSLIEQGRARGKHFVVAAPTGVAAINVGGVTVHRLINLLRGSDVPLELDFVLIDEASMLRADLFDGLEKALVGHQLRTYGGEPDFTPLPFGGVQLALVGDFAQLPPVVTPQDTDRMKPYKSPYCFSAHSFPRLDWKILELTEIFRQKDPRFITILNDIREGNIEQHLHFLNSNLVGSPIGAVVTATNEQAKKINDIKLRSIDEPPFSFRAGVSGRFEPREFPADEHLVLKKGARAMCIKNIYREGADGERLLVLVNGDVGTVTECAAEGARFLCHRTSEEINMSAKWSIWEKLDMVPCQQTITAEDGSKTTIEVLEEKIVGTFAQIPLRLAWATTVHKSQGMTFEKMTIDLSRPFFAYGQGYVAMSRAVSLEGLRIVGKFTAKDIKACPVVRDFMEKGMKSRYIESLDAVQPAHFDGSEGAWD